ncbi:hypothetical protein Pla163_06570 [Planctomycetes bacterium Pla163]|uniref:Uncharacterized protein n=1 Tax=Rohdeia mirabilis TaxID=2528008 RepID=A0A518CWI3_9BACT|nr:hypothetical protein Pla163_06570 [Planctomycetes bacterium Pla163]
MADSPWHILIACAVQFAIGALAVGLFAGRRTVEPGPFGVRAFGLAWPAVCWSCGALAVAGSGAVLAALDVALRPWWWTPLAALVAIVLGRAARRVPSVLDDPVGGSVTERTDAARHTRWIWWGFAAIWTAFSIDWIVLSTYLPVFQGDEASIWAAKAKAVYGLSGTGADLAQILPHDRIEGLRSHVHMAAYPWLGALLEAHVFAWAGEIVHFTVRVPLQLFAPLWVLALAEVARRSSAPIWWTLPFVVALGLAPEALVGMGHGLSQAPVVEGVVLLLVAQTLRGHLRGGLEMLALLQLVATKPEGIAVAVGWTLATVAVRVSRRDRDRTLVRTVLARPFVLRVGTILAPSVVVVAIHQALNRWWGLTHHLASAPVDERRTTHFVETASNIVQRHLFDFEHVFAATGLALVAFAVAPAFARRAPIHLFAVVLWTSVTGAYFLVLATSPYNVEWQWLTAGPRIFTHIAPAAAVAGFALMARRPGSADTGERAALDELSGLRR